MRSLRPKFQNYLVFMTFNNRIFVVSRSFDLGNLGVLRKSPVNIFNDYIFEMSPLVHLSISTDYFSSFKLPVCDNFVLVGNGFCNDETNIAACNFDGGDCCGSCVITEYCSNCDCLGGLTNVGMTNPLVGDGVCKDETNNAECNYDGGDCCLMNVNTDSCSDCNCRGIGVITSPGFPGKYDNNLDLNWLIQVQMGQTIEINFLSMDIEYGNSNCP